MKAEAIGELTIDPDMVRRLGLEGLTADQCSIASALFVSKPVVPTEAALHLLGIPVVQLTAKVISINTAPPGIRTRRITRGNRLCVAPVDKYRQRPHTATDGIDWDNMTLHQ